MPDYQAAPQIQGATQQEQVVVNGAWRLAEVLPDPRHVAPLRSALELIVDLIRDRGRRRDFLEQYDRPHDED